MFTAGRPTYLTCPYVSVSLLRKHGFKLPIEILHKNNEISKTSKFQFEHLDVEFRNFDELKNTAIFVGYALKPLAIINSRFKEALFLDADNNCTADTECLFNCKEYLYNGSGFWPDYWLTSKNTPIWAIIGDKDYSIPEQESGQILINKEKCWRELQLCLYFNRFSTYYY